MKEEAQKNPLVSVIVPAYNAAETLSETIDSIQRQTYSHWEIILLVEPSKDATQQIAQELAKQDSKIRLICNEKRLGVSGNRNKGLSVAKGEFIAILDADDVAYEERFAKQVKFLQENPDIFLVGTGITRIDWDGTVQRDIPQDVLTPEQAEKKLPKGNQFTHSTVMYRNVKDFIGYREKIFYGEDFDFFLRLLSSDKRLANLAEPLVKYRTALSSVTFSEYSWEIQKQMLDLIKIWHQERLATGKDSYDSFDPAQFKTLAESLSPRALLWQTIRTAVRANHAVAVRRESLVYLKKFGFNGKVIGALLYSFLPRKVVHFLKRITHKEF